MENKIELKNKFVYVRYDKDGIFAKDLTDIYNEESLFTQSKRKIKICFDELQKGFNEDFTFQTVVGIIRAYNIKYHRYCAID